VIRLQGCAGSSRIVSASDVPSLTVVPCVVAIGALRAMQYSFVAKLHQGKVIVSIHRVWRPVLRPFS
jgi:hypothetical protein